MDVLKNLYQNKENINRQRNTLMNNWLNVCFHLNICAHKTEPQPRVRLYAPWWYRHYHNTDEEIGKYLLSKTYRL